MAAITEISSTDIDAATRLEGKAAVVTGAGSGIGEAIAHVLGVAGASIVACDIDEVRLGETVEQMTTRGVTAVAQTVDVRSRTDLDAAVARAVAEFGGLDIQCNIAGVPPRSIEMIEVDDDDIDRELSISLKGVLHGCQAAAPVMAAAGGGVILNMSSTSIDIPATSTGLYHIGKSAAAALTRVLALELGPRGIRVNALAPGVTLTPFSTRHFTAPDGSVDDTKKRDWMQLMSTKSPLGIVGEPIDQALLALYLVSDAARFITGQVIRGNGGWTMT